ncbi:MAG: aldo/keto reductase [Magnetococcales bacterium]|nr:aldo/keto reductase [Magnetococcales bacterium]
MNDNDTSSLLSSYGVTMPRIIYGTAWKKERTAALVEQAIALGFRGIDTACQPKHYHEAGVGHGVAVASIQCGVTRAEFYLQSKFTPLAGQDPLRVPYNPEATLGEQVEQSLHVSLSNLQTSYLDCLVLHSPLATVSQTQQVWQAMEQLFHSGHVRQLGISNCYDLQQLQGLHQMAGVKPAVLQNRFYAATGYDRSLRAFCQQHQIVYQSFWTLSANPAVLNHPLLRAIADQYRRSTEQVLLRYLSQIGVVPLTGTTSATHMREDLAIFNFELTADECDSLDGILQDD